MAESNLRSLLATARGTNARPDAPVGDAEMAAILGVLKGDESENGSGEGVGVIAEPTSDPGAEEPETLGSSSGEPAVG
jgi:hypothetical protein